MTKACPAPEASNLFKNTCYFCEFSSGEQTPEPPFMAATLSQVSNLPPTWSQTSHQCSGNTSVSSNHHGQHLICHMVIINYTACFFCPAAKYSKVIIMMIRLLHLTLVCCLIALFFLLIPASILDSLEPNWTWLV